MIVSGSRVLGFAVAGLLALTAVVILDDDGAWEGVDPRTGFERAPGPEHLDEVRATGDARYAIELLAAAGGLGGSGAVRAAYAALALELTPPSAADVEPFDGRLVTAHPSAVALGSTAVRARAARARLAELAADDAATCARWLAGGPFDGGSVGPGEAPGEFPGERPGVQLDGESPRAAEIRVAVAAEVGALLEVLVADDVVARAARAFFELLPDAPAPDPGPGLDDTLGLDHEALAFELETWARVSPGAGDDQARSQAVALAARFADEDRPRGELRWLARCFGATPPDGPGAREVALALVDALLAVEELGPARAVLLAADSRDAVLVRRLAELSAWSDASTLESAALERLVELGEATDDERSRLVDVLLFAGEPERARVHAETLARHATSRAGRELPVTLALECGDVDGALALLQGLQRSAPDEPHWRDEELELLTQDLRFEELEARLAVLAQRDPEAFELRYEELLRARWRLEPLLALLVERCLRGDATAEERAEATGLARHLGDVATLRWLAARDLEPGGDPVRALGRLRVLEALASRPKGTGSAGVEVAGEPLLRDLRPRLAARLAATPLDAQRTVQALETLVRVGVDEALLQAILVAGAAHTEEPAVATAVLETLDGFDPAGALAFARAAAERRPDDALAWDRLAERAGWRGEVDLEYDARTRLASILDAEDARATEGVEHGSLRRQTADARASLALALGRPTEAHRIWRELLLARPSDPRARAWREGALVAAAACADAAVLAHTRRELLDGAPDEGPISLAVADTLFARELLPRAAPFYARVLELMPDEPTALLRLGQIRSWSEDPRGALAPLERLVALPGGATTESRFLLAEVLHALGEMGRAEPLFEQVVLEHDATREVERLWRARSLVRLGTHDAERLAAGLAELRALAEREGALPDLRVELAEGLLVAAAPAEARAELAAHLGRRPADIRAHRLMGRAALAEGDREGAIRSLLRAVALGDIAAETAPVSVGDDGAAFDLARVYDTTGEWRAARETTSAMLAARAGEPELRAFDQDLHERLALLGGALLSWRSVGDDQRSTLGVFGSTLVHDEWTRLAASLEWNEFTGRAAAVNLGATDVDAAFGSLRLTLDHRLAPAQRWALGLHAFPSAPGDGSVGAWAGYQLVDDVDSRWQVDARLHVADLWTDPFAAPGLGGRSTGAELEGFRALDARWWTSGGASLAEVSIDAPSEGEVADPLLRARVAVGRVLTAHVPRVAEPLSLERVGVLGFSPYLESRAAEGERAAGSAGHAAGSAETPVEGTHLQVYTGLDHQSLGSGAELAALLPIAEDATYLLVGARADRLLVHELGGMLEAVAGVDLVSGDPALSLDGGLTWRPRFGVEVLGRVGVGQALGRSDDELEVRLLFGVQLRR